MGAKGFDLYIEYEIPPFRAIHWKQGYIGGRTDEQIAADLAVEYPLARIRKICRKPPENLYTSEIDPEEFM